MKSISGGELFCVVLHFQKPTYSLLLLMQKLVHCLYLIYKIGSGECMGKGGAWRKQSGSLRLVVTVFITLEKLHAVNVC